MARDQQGKFKASAAFLQRQILEKQRGYAVETRNGTWFLPEEHIGKWDPVRVSARDYFGDYVDGGPESISGVEQVFGYFGRYSAPGFLDATDWTFYTSRRALERALRDSYGNDE